jgi:SPOR domain
VSTESYWGGVRDTFARFSLSISVALLSAAAALPAAPSPQFPRQRGIGVQVGAFQRPEGAARLTRELEEKGYPARTLPTASLHRVIVGPLPNQSAAETVLAELKQLGYNGYVRTDVPFGDAAGNAEIEAHSRPPADPVVFDSPGRLRLAPGTPQPAEPSAAAPEPQAPEPLRVGAPQQKAEAEQPDRVPSEIAPATEPAANPPDLSVEAGIPAIGAPVPPPSAPETQPASVVPPPQPAAETTGILPTTAELAAAGETAVPPKPAAAPVEDLPRDVTPQAAPDERAAAAAQPPDNSLLAQAPQTPPASPASPAGQGEPPAPQAGPAAVPNEPPAAQVESPAAAAQVESPAEPAASEQPAAGEPKLAIKILGGDEVVNTVGQRSARDPVVQVVDENDRPVGGAVVVFDLPARGASGTFANGARSVTVLTSQDGTATATGFTANSAQGQFAMQVTASHQGQTASTVVAQTNAAASGGISAAATAGIVAGIAGGAAVALVIVKNSIENRVRQEVAARNPPSVITTITPGASAVGAP